MKPITKVSFTLPLLLSAALLVSISACTGAKTATDAPSSTNQNEQVSTAKDAKTTQDDAQSEIRKKQLEADIRAREQRNNVDGNAQNPSEDDLASEVRNKLEANIPGSKLTVSSKDAEVTVAGVVKSQKQLDKIKPLAMEIKGVRNVVVKAAVNP